MPEAGGIYRFGVSCTGPGGTVAKSATITVPIPVHATSYENAKRTSLPSNPRLPSPDALGVANPTWFHAATGFADFFQEGRLSVVVNLAKYSAAAQTAGEAAPDLPSKTMFLRMRTDGSWYDATSELLRDDTGCIHPRKAVIADFNGDAKPDVFFACHGYDGTPDPAKGRVWGEYQRMLLSQADGSYANLRLPYFVYGHGASAADLNRDGKPDIVLTNTSTGPAENPRAPTDRQPLVLINLGGGEFQVDTTRLPANWQFTPIYAFELIDVSGNGAPDLFVGAYEANATGNPWPADPNRVGNLWAKNDGTGHFVTTIKIPNLADSSGMFFNLGQDFVYENGSLYMLQTSEDYTDVAVRKVRLSDLSTSFLYSSHGTYSDGWFPWIYPVQSDVLLGYNNEPKVSISR